MKRAVAGNEWGFVTDFKRTGRFIDWFPLGFNGILGDRSGGHSTIFCKLLKSTILNGFYVSQIVIKSW